MGLEVEKFTHVSVLGERAPEALLTDSDGIYVDATFGRGGHSRKILSKLSSKGRLYAFDRDAEAVEAAKTIHDPRFQIIQSPFSRMREELVARDVRSVTGILMDIGVSSPQIDNADRGFSFRNDGPLDMRMDQTSGVTASEWLMLAETGEIERVLKDYSEERYARRIAEAICKARGETPITRTAQLAALIARCVPANKFDKAQHPATRSFQAIRIHINHELDELKSALHAAGSLLCEDGKLAVISFHSLEDRIVKNFFFEGAHPETVLDKRIPLRAEELPQPYWYDLQRIKPDERECETNPRSRSAVMRVATRSARTWSEVRL